MDGCSERARHLTEGDSRDDRVSPEPLLLEPAQPLVCTLPPDEAGITPQYLAHHSIMQPRARPNRARCQCLCGCRRRPGRRAACEVCQQLVGPGCCVETTTPLRCHVCAYHFPARDLQRQQMQTQSHHSQQQLRQAPQQPKQGAWAQRDRDEREVAEGTPETSTRGKERCTPMRFGIRRGQIWPKHRRQKRTHTLSCVASPWPGLPDLPRTAGRRAR